ncbi:MAG: hypothetical protein AAF253_00005 [Pseudomonadota bacterium]
MEILVISITALGIVVLCNGYALARNILEQREDEALTSPRGTSMATWTLRDERLAPSNFSGMGDRARDVA